MALTDNIISYWKMDESSGNAADSVGSNTGTNVNVTYSTGKINNGAVFNGTSATMNTTNNITLTGTNTLTIAAWANITSLSSAYRRIAGFYTSNACVLGLTNTNKFRWFTLTGGAVDIASSLSPSTGTWYHVVGTYDGTNAKLYINGTLDTSTAQTGNFTTSNSPLEIGYVSVPGEYFPGTIDEVGIWSRALTSTEVTSLYNGGSGLAYPFSAGGPANLKSYNTNVKANIKSIDTNLIANVKSLDTNV